MGETTEFEQALARKIGPVLKRLYPQNPDVVLGREARIIAEAIAPEVMGAHDPSGLSVTEEYNLRSREQVMVDTATVGTARFGGGAA